MTTNTYADGYLAKLITNERESRAIEEVAALEITLPTWRTRLEIQRAYIIACIESQASADDLFAQKLSAYRKEFDTTLTQARMAKANQSTETTTSGIFSISLERA